ncbi:MAG: hypothetical protein K6G65_06825 [Lachnospiraceae bacterium]|nr:hypothetical protein [Lachnospiraceae bacterium]
MINGISGYSPSAYYTPGAYLNTAHPTGKVSGVHNTNPVGKVPPVTGVTRSNPAQELTYAQKVNRARQGDTSLLSSTELRALKRTGQIECATCASRQYQDGSDEADVSFKSAAHIDPGSAAGKVMAHEQEHVANAYQKAEKANGRVISANVSIQHSVCPECGRNYVSGGLTRTTIAYPKDTPYGKNQKAADYGYLAGANFDSKS